jgi:hypothetical protein
MICKVTALRCKASDNRRSTTDLGKRFEMKPVYTLSVLVLLSACAGAPSDSEATTPTPSASKPAATNSEDSKVVVLDNSVTCTYEQSTGTRLKKKVCMTAEERKARADEDRKAVEQGRQRSRANGKANP